MQYSNTITHVLDTINLILSKELKEYLRKLLKYLFNLKSKSSDNTFCLEKQNYKIV